MGVRKANLALELVNEFKTIQGVRINQHKRNTRGSLGATRYCVRTRARSVSNSIETRKKCFLFPSLNSLLKTIKKIYILILITFIQKLILS